ncbi:hypothetical protein HYV82_06160 [Candidatus Woesearchaeota archaeon]|nr:hypothetical protein [Candidatus Woesearchaeota archaeon]
MAAAIAGLGSGYEKERLLEGIGLFVRARNKSEAQGNNGMAPVKQKVSPDLFLSYLGLQQYAPAITPSK